MEVREAKSCDIIFREVLSKMKLQSWSSACEACGQTQHIRVFELLLNRHGRSSSAGVSFLSGLSNAAAKDYLMNGVPIIQGMTMLELDSTVTALLQHGRIGVPHASTTATCFPSLRNLEEERASTLGRVNLYLQFATGNLMELVSAWLI